MWQIFMYLCWMLSIYNIISILNVSNACQILQLIIIYSININNCLQKTSYNGSWITLFPAKSDVEK